MQEYTMKKEHRKKKLEKLIKESFVKQVVKKKRNARSGKTAHNNKNNAEI